MLWFAGIWLWIWIKVYINGRLQFVQWYLVLFVELIILAWDVYDDGSELGCTSDVESKKLTRAQRKRIRKRKLKEAASVRRKIIGPLLPSSDQDLNKPSKKPSHENLPESRQDSAEHLSC